ncbi:MAG TPA: helix-turn-helix domain-containing protein [Leucothrix mucor]|nr:helix-turn-helix domain-containing protein [Leucothrix mucor]
MWVVIVRQQEKKLRVAILAYENLSFFEFGCALELFALDRPELLTWYQTDILSLNNKVPLSPISGLSVECSKLFHSLQAYDLLIIPGWTGVDDAPPEYLLAEIRALHKRGGRIASFCSGAYVVAASGLLDGAKATTHWQYEEHFSGKFSQIEFVENVLYTDSNRVYTSAGSAAGLDLGIYIIRQDFGESIANHVAKRLVISASREGGQAQYSEQKIQQMPDRLGNTIDWVKSNLNKNIKVQEMADHACLSRRSFDRKFQFLIGCSPKKWLIQQRLYLAREYLESSQLSIDMIAEKSGFGTAMNMRHHFSKLLGVSPQRYRLQFL